MVGTSLLPSYLPLLATLASALPPPLESGPTSSPTVGGGFKEVLQDGLADNSLGSTSGKEDRAESTVNHATEIEPDDSLKETLDMSPEMSQDSKPEKKVNIKSTNNNLKEETPELSL